MRNAHAHIISVKIGLAFLPSQTSLKWERFHPKLAMESDKYKSKFNINNNLLCTK